MEKAPGERFEDIEAWQSAQELTRRIYGCHRKAKFAHDFGLKGRFKMQKVTLNL